MGPIVSNGEWSIVGGTGKLTMARGVIYKTDRGVFNGGAKAELQIHAFYIPMERKNVRLRTYFFIVFLKITNLLPYRISLIIYICCYDRAQVLEKMFGAGKWAAIVVADSIYICVCINFRLPRINTRVFFIFPVKLNKGFFYTRIHIVVGYYYCLCMFDNVCGRHQ